MDQYKKINEYRRKDALRHSIFIFGLMLGLVLLGIYLAGMEIGQISYMIIMLTTVLLIAGCLLLAMIGWSEYSRMKRQIVNASSYLEYQTQQTDMVKADERYAWNIYTEHYHSMFWEIYLNQAEAHLAMGGIFLLLLYVMEIVSFVDFFPDAGAKEIVIYSTQDFILPPLVIIAGVFMFSGFMGKECKKIKAQIARENWNRSEIEKEYKRGVVYGFAKGYFNISPEYTFIIYRQCPVIICNCDLQDIWYDITNTEVNMNGVKGQNKQYSVTIAAKSGKTYKIFCDALTGTLVINAVRQKIAEYEIYGKE